MDPEKTAAMEAQFAGAGLFMATQNNEMDAVRKQLDGGTDVNSSMNDGLTPLFMAVANKRFEMATMLLERGANVNCALKDSNATPLCLAAQHGSMEFCKLLLDKGADPNVVMKGGIGAFFLAVQGPSIDVARFFLESGADINCRMESTGATPLIVAVLKNKVEVVEMLLAKGADVSLHLKGGASLWNCGEELQLSDIMAEKLAQASTEGKLGEGHKWTALAVAEMMGYAEVADKIRAAAA